MTTLPQQSFVVIARTKLQKRAVWGVDLYASARLTTAGTHRWPIAAGNRRKLRYCRVTSDPVSSPLCTSQIRNVPAARLSSRFHYVPGAAQGSMPRRRMNSWADYHVTINSSESPEHPTPEARCLTRFCSHCSNHRTHSDSGAGGNSISWKPCFASRSHRARRSSPPTT